MALRGAGDRCRTFGREYDRLGFRLWTDHKSIGLHSRLCERQNRSPRRSLPRCDLYLRSRCSERESQIVTSNREKSEGLCRVSGHWGGRMSKCRVIICIVVGLGLTGCVTNDAIVAGAVDTVGISASGGATDQGGNLVVGFKGAKFAVVPVQTDAGKLLFLPDGAKNKEKGFSVLALLGVDSAVGADTGIHQVLAVGKPADLWALGQARQKVTVSGTGTGAGQ